MWPKGPCGTRLGHTVWGTLHQEACFSYLFHNILHNVHSVRFCELIVKGVCRQRVGSFCVSFRYFMYNFY